jgi:hypothetical protein
MRIHRYGPAAALLLALAVGTAAPTRAQEASDTGAVANNGLRVFYECSGGFRGGGCDSREFRTQIDWVNWVRDRQDAQVHVIITSQETGSGGNSYQLDFIGLEGLEGVTDQLAYTSLGTDVRDETVQGLTRVLAVGLARYSLLSGSDAVLEIRQPEGAGVPDRLVTSDQVDDPWDFWVFRVSTNSSLSGESRRSNARAGGSFSATRVTPDWKFEFDAGGNWRESKTEVDDTTTYVDTRRDWRAEMGLAYSLADHWSVGTEMRASAATQTNQDLSVSLNTALEYSIWPYEEATRRSLRLRYIVGMRHFNYEEETLFGYMEETRGVQAVEVSVYQRQPWGNVFANLEGSHYLHDFSKRRIGSHGNLSFRIVRGLNLNVGGGASWVSDQLYVLPDEDISYEELLLQRRRLASDFDWDFRVGFSFQFGSIFNNVVNNRF